VTVLDNKRFCSIGSDKEQQVDVRVIYATNANLLALVKTGKFRSDLYFRIAKFPVYFPPLRHRREDIKALTLSYLNKRGKTISTAALKKLEMYNWPGNIRQLKNCVEISCELCNDSVIQPDHIFF